MSAMTKVSSEPFWPSRAEPEVRFPFPKLTSESTSSTISPLTLPRGVSGYFDQASKTAGPAQLLPVTHAPSHGAAPHNPRRSQVYSPLSPVTRGQAARSASFLSPQLPPSVKEGLPQLAQPRSNSLPPQSRNSIKSPTRLGNPSLAMAINVKGSSPLANQSTLPADLAAAGQLRSVSADGLTASPQTLLAQRLVQQNARIREAWEAERKYLEANRERAEEVYKEERAMMEEERTEWEAEKAALLQEIARLRQALGGGSPQPATGMRPHSRASFTNPDQREGPRTASRVSPNSSLSSQSSAQPGSHSAGPGLRKGGFPKPTTGPRVSDLNSPRSPNGPSVPTPDFLKPSEGSDVEINPVPIVDVQEIHPELEGIPIKATSVKKATFTDTESQKGSTASSPSGASPPDSDQAKSPRGKKEQTLQVLAAREADRLTMHAGHTPNHSLSSLATVTSSGSVTSSSGSGESTPTMTHEDGSRRRAIRVVDEERDDLSKLRRDSFSGSVTNRHGHPLFEPIDHHLIRTCHPEPIFEPIEDRPLKGPLMVRNMPAHDEIFFRKLSDKLKEVSKDDTTSLPAVLKDATDDAEKKPDESADQSKAQTGNQPVSQPVSLLEVAGSDGPGSDSGKGSSKGSDGEELDVPIKFKKRMNFGAPFGEFR